MYASTATKIELGESLLAAQGAECRSRILYVEHEHILTPHVGCGIVGQSLDALGALVDKGLRDVVLTQRLRMAKRAERRQPVTWASQPEYDFGPIALYFTGRAEGREHLVWGTGRTEAPLGLVFSAVVAGREDALPKPVTDIWPLPDDTKPISYRDDLYYSGVFPLAKDWLVEPQTWPPNVVLPPGGLRDAWQRQRFAWAGMPDHIGRGIRTSFGKVIAFDVRQMRRIQARALRAEKWLDEKHPGWRELGTNVAQNARESLRRVQALSRFVGKSTCDALYWHPSDLITAAWVEIIHAKRTGGTAAKCKECAKYFLVPHGYRTTRCPLCR
jgi:hypothetical protein